jgi:hypothetical protein
VAVLLNACGQGSNLPQATSSAASQSAGNGSSSAAPTGAKTSASPAASTAVAPQGQLVAYIKDGDIWVVGVDGGSGAQLTTNGANGAYTDPSFAPDGSIYAIRNKNQLVHIDLTGHPVGEPVTLAVLENGAEGLSVSPDGAHMAYVTTGFGTYVDPRFGTPNGAFIYGGADVIVPDGTSVSGAAMPGMLYPTWSGSTQLVATDGIAIFAAALGSEPVSWIDASDGCLIEFDCPPGQEAAANVTRPVISQDGSVLAYEYQPYYGSAGRRLASLDGATPGAAPQVRCEIAGQENFSDAGALSGDGSVFAFDDSAFDPTTLDTTAGKGVWVMTVDLSAADCGASSARLVGPGGQEPDVSSGAR